MVVKKIMPKLYPHQNKFLQKNPDKALLAWEGNTGKTLAGVEWLRSRQGNAIVVVPKRIKQKWITALGDVKANVLTKEEWKKYTNFTPPTALLLDEAHHHNSPAFTRQRSQLTDKTYNFIKQNPDMPVLLETATPISSNPANLHTLLCFIGVFIPWKQWRDEFYELKRLPFLPRPAYMPKSDWRIKIRKYLVKYASIVLMRDCMELPDITEEIIPVKYEKYIPDPLVEISKKFITEFRHEQINKAKIIREIGGEYRKVMVAVFFRDQIEELYKELSKDKKTYVLHGGITNQEEVAKQAEEDDECYFICQSGCGEGFDSPSFNILIFASMSYPYTHFKQIRWRITRGNELKPKRYIYLLSGRIDKAIFNQVSKGKDFDVTEFTKNSY